MPPQRFFACSVDGCTRPYLAKGYCRMHYWRWKKSGATGPVETVRILGRKCSVEGCERKHVAFGLCMMHRERKRRTGEVGPAEKLIGKHPGCVTSQGYRVLSRKGHPNAWGKGVILEHILVMSEMLGRPLRKGETVHHKNGNRLDNRPANLELWSGAQPSGQRVTDKIEFAAEIISNYLDDESLWPARLRWLREHILTPPAGEEP